MGCVPFANFISHFASGNILNDGSFFCIQTGDYVQLSAWPGPNK